MPDSPSVGSDDVKESNFTEINIELLPVKSGNINSIGYSSEHQLLRILFKNGALYQYMKVKPEAYEQLVKSESIGGTFDRSVRNFYQYIRIS